MHLKLIYFSLNVGDINWRAMASQSRQVIALASHSEGVGSKPAKITDFWRNFLHTSSGSRNKSSNYSLYLLLDTDDGGCAYL
jgi:hypothetical protein